MAHEFFGVQAAEDRHHAHQHDHDHDHHDHFHDHPHGDAAEEARWAGFWLFITLIGGLLVVTSYYVRMMPILSRLDAEEFVSHVD